MLTFRKGEVFFCDPPYATSVCEENFDFTCNWCFRTRFPDPIKCATCSKVSYCSTKCRDKDARFHTFECLALTQPDEIYGENERFTLRAIRRVLDERETNSRQVGHFFGHSRTYEDLLSHADLFTGERLQRYENEAKRLSTLLSNNGYDISEELLLEAIQKFMINAHSVRDPDFIVGDRRIGNALYLGGSKANHSCEFREHYVELFIGNRYMFRALEDFSVSDSQEITVHYIPTRWTYLKRQLELKRKYYFDCECARCVRESQEPHQLVMTMFESVLVRMNLRDNMRELEAFERRLESFPKINICRNLLHMKMYFGGRRYNADRSYYLAMSILAHNISIYERLKVLFLICVELDLAGAGDSSHSYHDKFKELRSRALALFIAVYGQSHRLVWKLLSIAPIKKAPLALTMTAHKDTLAQVGQRTDTVSVINN